MRGVSATSSRGAARWLSRPAISVRTGRHGSRLWVVSRAQIVFSSDCIPVSLLSLTGRIGLRPGPARARRPTWPGPTLGVHQQWASPCWLRQAGVEIHSGPHTASQCGTTPYRGCCISPKLSALTAAAKRASGNGEKPCVLAVEAGFLKPLPLAVRGEIERWVKGQPDPCGALALYIEGTACRRGPAADGFLERRTSWGLPLARCQRRKPLPRFGTTEEPPFCAPPFSGSAPVAQLDRAPDYESGGREFESSPVRQ